MRRNLSKSLGATTVTSMDKKIIIAQRREQRDQKPYRVSLTVDEAEEVVEQILRNVKLLKALEKAGLDDI
jgi:hypothetical protein